MGLFGRGRGIYFSTAAHTADINRDWVLSLSEVLRVIQLFNAREAYGCEGGTPTEDRYDPFGEYQYCYPHNADYAPTDFSISLSELLSTIQLYNARGYHACADGEDGFCPGAEEVEE